ncbi:MAG TPA: thiamine pyrophosphate-binding protein, partial [Polyangiaceae bacterium]|nr:thiamine pyrophosphate-binding protein [Polyangiaceae bacterium]
MKDLGVPAAAAEAANLADTGEFDCRVLNSGNFPSLSREEGELIPTGEVLGRALRVLGVERAYGVMGGGCARLISGIEGGGVQLIHMRHESSAAFSACEEYLARGTPAAIWTTTGPGFVNALNGVTAIGWEGAKALFLSGATGHDVRPGFGFQDTREHNLAALRHLAAPHAKLALSYPQTPSDVYELLDEWRSALTRPGAFIGAALVPLQLQQLSMKAWVPRPIDDAVSEIGFRSDAYERLARELESGTVLIWTGFGARGASAELRELVSRLDARVISSPRSKGTFPEDDPAYLGVTGHGGHERVLRYMQETGVDTMLILGTRLHELTSFRDRRFSPRRTVIHVDCDRSA